MITVYLVPVKNARIKKIDFSQLKKDLVVQFDYPESKAPWEVSLRVVKVLSTTREHLVGLEMGYSPSGNRTFKYKKYLKEKMEELHLIESIRL